MCHDHNSRGIGGKGRNAVGGTPNEGSSSFVCCRPRHSCDRTTFLCTLQALTIRKDDPYALVARARTYAKMGVVKESLDDINTVLKEDPDNHQV